MRLVRRILMPADYCEHEEESDDIGERDVPAVPEPETHRFRLRIYVGERDPRARAEPDHRAAEADAVGEIPPVVAALLERERGERNVVEHRRNKTEAERGLP